jgi:hypothetical protein
MAIAVKVVPLRTLQQSCSSLLPLRRRRGSLESPNLQELRVMETLIPCAIRMSMIMIPQLMLLLASRLMSSTQQLRGRKKSKEFHIGGDHVPRALSFWV